MLILDDTPPSPAKTTNISDLPSTSLRSDPPPPAYGAVPPLPPPHALVSYPSIHRPLTPPSDVPKYPSLPDWFKRRQPRSPWIRFLEAFVIALLIWFLISWTTRITRATFGGNSPEYLIPNDLGLLHCIGGDGWTEEQAYKTINSHSYPYYSKQSFELPASSDTTFIIARGSLSAGNVHLATSPSASDQILVQVEAHYYTPEVMDNTKVCRVKRSRKQLGVGLFTPKRWLSIRWEDRPYFNVTVFLPRNAKMNTFETDVPNYSHTMNDLEGRVSFESLSLKGDNGAITGESISFRRGAIETRNGKIDIQSLHADQAEIRSTNAPITGHYVSSGDLTIQTSNGAIKASVEFGNPSSARASRLDISSENAIIDTEITVVGKKSEIMTRTSNGALFAKILEAPIDSTLNLDARTSNSIADVLLPDTYEGSYALTTSNSATQVRNERQWTIKDPTGKGRTRSVVNRTSSKGTSAGNIYWDSKAADRGTVKVRSSNGGVTLRL